MKRIILNVGIICSLISCTKKNEPQPLKECNLVELPTSSEYLQFGRFSGECYGPNCSKMYLLTETKLFKDTLSTYPGNAFYEGKYVLLSAKQNEKTKGLIESFPLELLDDTNSVIGCPDCYDQGGVYVEYNFKGVKKHWTLDQDKKNVPQKYHLFLDNINSKIDSLAID